MDFLTSTILSGVAWDGIKLSGKVTVGFLKDKLRGWLIGEDDIEKIVDKLNAIPEGYKKNVKFLEAAIEEDQQLLQLINKIQQRQDTQINLQNSHNEKSTVISGGSGSTITNTTTNHIYQETNKENKPKERAELRKEIKDLLFENATIFKMYGPTETNKYDLATQKHEAWKSMAKEMIVPNNEKIIELLEDNINILNEEERETLIQFKIHARGFKDNQYREERISDYPQFPLKMNDILS
jgi:hypothetical protein